MNRKNKKAVWRASEPPAWSQRLDELLTRVWSRLERAPITEEDVDAQVEQARTDCMLRAVIDTNLFVRGLLKGPVTLPLLHAWKAERFVLVTFEQLIAESFEVLSRPKFERYFSKDDIREPGKLIYERAEIVEPSKVDPSIRKSFLATTGEFSRDCLSQKSDGLVVPISSIAPHTAQLARKWITSPEPLALASEESYQILSSRRIASKH